MLRYHPARMPDRYEFTLDQVTGRTREHLVEVSGAGVFLHQGAAAPYLAMRAAAEADGIELTAFSGFRDFDRQLAIWNGKFRGERPMQDRSGQPLNPLELTSRDRVEAILWWSALPGASRHHWGTDFDVMDAAAVPLGYRLQVIPAEYAAGGPFERLTGWLDTHMHQYGFFRPYASDRGGVRPEAWHLSYAPLAAGAQTALTPDGLRAVIAAAEIEGKDDVLESLGGTFANYVLNVDVPPEAALMSPRLA